MLTFTLVNSELRNISNDKVTLNCLITNILRCHLSFVIFAFTLSLKQIASCLWDEFCEIECVQNPKNGVPYPLCTLL